MERYSGKWKNDYTSTGAARPTGLLINGPGGVTPGWQQTTTSHN